MWLLPETAPSARAPGQVCLRLEAAGPLWTTRSTTGLDPSGGHLLGDAVNVAAAQQDPTFVVDGHGARRAVDWIFDAWGGSRAHESSAVSSTTRTASGSIARRLAELRRRSSHRDPAWSPSSTRRDYPGARVSQFGPDARDATPEARARGYLRGSSRLAGGNRPRAAEKPPVRRRQRIASQAPSSTAVLDQRWPARLTQLGPPA